MNHWYDLKLPRNKAGIQNTKLYNGKEYEPELGLYYYRNRYYSPTLGKFISQDPLLYIDGPNPYTYVNNNPVNFVDPWGLASSNGGFLINTKAQYLGGEIRESNNPWYKNVYNDIIHSDTVQTAKSNTIGLVGKSTIDGCIKGDYNENNNKSSIGGQILCGELPGISIAADTRDLKAAIDDCDGLSRGCVGNVVLNGVGFIPFAGSVKHIKHTDKAAGLVKGVGKGVKGLIKSAKKTPSMNQVQKIIKTKSAPKGIRRLDSTNLGPYEQPHIHFDGGGALNIDGTRKHKPKVPLKNSQKKWLDQVGRKLPQ